MTALSPPPGFGFPRQHSPPQPQVEKPKRSMKVSWASGENLCQVRLFVAEDAPVMSGAVQDQLQAKPTRNLHMCNPTLSGPASDAPPGFGGVPVKSQPDHMALAAIVPQISWRPPSKVHLDPTWHVMAGGASLETGLQKQREVRILEAVYPRPSSIPESPAEPVEAQEPYDDSTTPQIPLVPLEEEDVPDGSDVSALLSGPRFLSQGASSQAGAQPMTVLNGRPEKVKQYIGDSLPGLRPDILNVRNDSAWGNATVGPTTRPVDHSSDIISGRPPPAVPLPAGPLPNIHTNSKQNGVQPDVAAATAAAFAALSKSQEIGSMIDNELLIRILSDPSILQTLTSTPTFPVANSKPEISSNMNMNGASRLPDKINQVTNGVIGRVANHWISPPSTSYTTVPIGGQDGGRSRSSESYINAGDRFQRTQVPEERPSTLQPGAVNSAQLGNSQLGTNQLYTDPTNGGRVAIGQFAGLSSSSDAPPGFGSSKLNVNGNNMTPGFSASQLGAQTAGTPQVGPSSASRPLSRLDEQYFKSLILQHGSANNDDQGRAVVDKGSTGARSTYNAQEVKRWNGMEQVDVGRPDRNARERQENETGPGSGVETASRPKSRKVCIYFGTARGCRNGDNCTFVHEISETTKRPQKMRSAPTQVPYAKRLRVDS